jgi:acyl-CoA thioesterase
MSEEKASGRRGFSPFVRWMGIQFSAVENGYSRCSLEVNENMMNSAGILHGGVVYSLADTGMGGSLHSSLAEGERCATIELKIAYLAAVNEGELVCESNVIHRGDQIAVIESDVRNGNRHVARALGTFAIFKADRSDSTS